MAVNILGIQGKKWGVVPGVTSPCFRIQGCISAIGGSAAPQTLGLQWLCITAMSVRSLPHYAHHLHNYIAPNVYAEAPTGPCSSLSEGCIPSSCPVTHSYLDITSCSLFRIPLLPSIPFAACIPTTTRHKSSRQRAALPRTHIPAPESRPAGPPLPNLVPNALGFNLSHSMQERGNNTCREETASIHSGYVRFGMMASTLATQIQVLFVHNGFVP